MEKQTAEKIVEALSGVYPDKPALRYETEFQLLIAVILSAQCTDERVNRVTAELFPEYGMPEKMLSLAKEELGKKIFSCGLYNSKAEHILSACSDIVTRFHGEVPRTLEELRTLAGVGRKTANVVYSVAMGGDAVAVDPRLPRNQPERAGARERRSEHRKAADGDSAAEGLVPHAPLPHLSGQKRLQGGEGRELRGVPRLRVLREEFINVYRQSAN